MGPGDIFVADRIMSRVFLDEHLDYYESQMSPDEIGTVLTLSMHGPRGSRAYGDQVIKVLLSRGTRWMLESDMKVTAR